MPSTDVVREMSIVMRFEELSHTPLLTKVLAFLRLPGACEQLGMSKSCSDGQLLRALGDQASPSSMLRSFGVDLSTAVQAEASLQVVIASTTKPMISTSKAQQLATQEAYREFMRACCRCWALVAFVFAAFMLLTSSTLLVVGLWKVLGDWDLHFMDWTITAMDFFIGSIGTGSLALLIVVIRLMPLCCRCVSCYRCCSKGCCMGVRDGCLDSRPRRQVAHSDEEDVPPVPPPWSALQAAALRQISQQQLSGQLSPQLSDHISQHLSEHPAASNPPYQPPQAVHVNFGESQLALQSEDMTGRPGDELAVYSPSEAPPILHSPKSLGSTVHSGCKSVSFEPEASDFGTTAVTALPKADYSMNDPGSYAWHSPDTYSFAARFMGLYVQEDLHDPQKIDEARFKFIADRMRSAKHDRVTFSQYADDVVGNPVAEMETFRKNCSQFYINTMFHSDTVYPDFHPDSKKSKKQQPQLRAMAASRPVEKPPAPAVKPFKLQRPVSCLSKTNTMMTSPGRQRVSAGPGNSLGLTAPAAFRVGTSELPMLSPASTHAKGRLMKSATSPSQFPYRPKLQSDESRDCLRKAAIA